MSSHRLSCPPADPEATSAAEGSDFRLGLRAQHLARKQGTFDGHENAGRATTREPFDSPLDSQFFYEIWTALDGLFERHRVAALLDELEEAMLDDLRLSCELEQEVL